MAFEIPSDLNPALVGLAWLRGRWEGTGYREWPGEEKIRFAQQVDFSDNGGDYLHYLAQSFEVDDDGKPLHLLLSRLRKTHKALWYTKTEGHMARFAVGHSREVAARHYADLPSLRPLHETAVADAFRAGMSVAEVHGHCAIDPWFLVQIEDLVRLEREVAQQGLAGALQIRSIPTLMIFRDGVLLFSQPGALPASALDELLKKVREVDMDDVRKKLAAAAPKPAAEKHA